MTVDDVALPLGGQIRKFAIKLEFSSTFGRHALRQQAPLVNLAVPGVGVVDRACQSA